MKTSFIRSLAAVLLIALAALACNRGEKAAGTAANETIAPAKPQPDSTGTADLTQTVDIEDSRSEAEGGVLTDRNAVPSTDTVTSATAATNTAGTTTTATAPPTTTTR